MLPITLEAEPDESWLSFLKRYSRNYHLPLGEVARAVGALGESGRRFRPDFMMEPPAPVREAWDGDVQSLEAMFHSRFRNVYGGDWSRYSQHEWIHLLHSPICPECLRGGAGSWRVTWHVPFVFLCQEHGKLLSHECPGCGHEHSHGWRDGSNSPLFLKYVADTRTCMNPGDSEAQALDVQSKRPCRFDLTAVLAIPVTDTRLLAAQEQVMRILRSEAPAYSFGAEGTQRQWVYDLRTLVAYLTYAAPASLAAGYPAPFAEAWTTMCKERDTGIIDRQARKAKGAWDHSFKTAPPPAIMAIAICHALPLMSLSKDQAVSAVRDLNEFSTTSTASRSRKMKWRDANSSSFAIVVHSASIADGSVQAFLGAHPERHAASRHEPPPHVPVEAIELRLPRFAKALDPGHVLLGFDLMVRYFRDPSAKRWTDVKLQSDPAAIVSIVKRLVTVAGTVGEARELGEFIVDYSLARVPVAPASPDSGPEPPKLDFRHLPNYLPSDYFAVYFEETLAELRLDSYLARSTAAFLLAKVSSGFSDIEVMERLRYPEGTIRDRILRAAVRLRGRKLNDAVAARARDLLSILVQRHPPVDYVERARAYETLMVLPPNDWAVIAANGDTAHGRAGSNESYAAALVWAELTGNGWKESPFIREGPGKLESRLETVRRFELHMAPPLKRELMKYVNYLNGGGALGHYYPDSPAHLNQVQPFEIPQLCWQSVYQERFQRYFDGLDVSERTARAVCSMAILGRVVDAPYSRLGELLALDSRLVDAGIERARLLITSGPDSENFERSVEEFLEHYSGQTDRANYSARRFALRALEGIPEEDWMRICSTAGVGPGHPGGRNIYCAMWLWANLTEGDPFQSPAFKALQKVRKRAHLVVVYRKINHEVVPLLKMPLTEYGTALLQG